MVDRPGAYVAQLIVNDGTVDSAPDRVTISGLLSGAFAILATTEEGTPVDDAVPSANLGQAITIAGTDLMANINVTFPTVDDNGVAGVQTVRVSTFSADGTSATVSVPLMAVTGNMTVEGTAGSFRLQVAPKITSFSNDDFRAGELVTLAGSGFVEGGMTVNFGAVAVDDPGVDIATINVFNVTRNLHVVIPQGAGPEVSVVTEGGTNNTVNLQQSGN